MCDQTSRSDETNKISSEKTLSAPENYEKPLSPVLSNNKFMYNRRIIKRNTRKKLIDKSVPEVKKSEFSLDVFNEESFTLSQTENLMSTIDRLEEIERNRDKIHKIITASRSDSFDFKKPMSPIVNRAKIVKIISNNDDNIEKEVRGKEMIKKVEIQNIATYDIPKEVDFTTCNGNKIFVSNENIMKHTSLFSDIFDVNDKTRERKFNFLRKKSDSNESNESLINCGYSEPFEDTILEKIPGKREGKIKNMEMLENIFEGEIFEENKNSDTNFQNSSKNNIFQDENLDDILKKSFDNCAFQPASLNEKNTVGKNIEIKNSLKNFTITGKPLKSVKNIFGDENFDDLVDTNQISNTVTFSKPNIIIQKSPKKCALNEKPLNTTKSIFDENFDNILKNSFDNCGFQTAASLSNKNNVEKNIETKNSLKSFTISGKPLNSVKNIFSDENFDDLFNKNQISKSISFLEPKIIKENTKKYALNGKPLSMTRNIFEGESFDDLYNKPSTSKLTTFEKPNISKISSKNFALNGKPLHTKKNIFENENFNDILNKKETNTNSFQKSKTLLQKNDDLLGFTKYEIQASQTASENTLESLNYLTQLLDFLKYNTVPPNFKKSRKYTESPSSYEPPFKKIKLHPTFDSKTNLTRRSLFSSPKSSDSPEDGYKMMAKRCVKKRLGVPSACKTIPIANCNIENAKSLFERELKPIECNNSNNTPVRGNTTFVPKYNSTPGCNVSKKFEDIMITPIRESEGSVIDESCDFENTLVAQNFCFQVSKESGIDEFVELFSNEKKSLEERLRNVANNLKCLEENKKAFEENLKTVVKPQTGVLSVKKSAKSRIKLQDFICCESPGEKSNALDPLFRINPQNAELFHFISKESIVTEDGTTVVPNLRNQIGLNEIENSFKCIRGVDTKLLPKCWIKNHYKWIVWKLGSYERMFPDKFESCLTVENVIQQLKYRYDREIDKAERSALRKIYEKDVASQIRIILCVSNISKVHGSYELELTDGWYSIRTVIDEPLNYQILKRKIVVGTKLVIYGAELLNCEGCYPLECTDLACLKINYNSTRRAKWYSKLGFQKMCSPYPILIEYIHPNGGNIGKIDVYIARVYPTKYMEKSGNKTIWRNRKAEDAARNKFEMNRAKKYEEIRDKLLKEKNMNYDNNQIFSKLEEEINIIYPLKQFSTALNKVLVVDILNNKSERGYNLTMWRQEEIYESIFKEGDILSIINILPSKNGELCANNQTKYIRKPRNEKLFEKYRRHVTPISVLLEINYKAVFNEFDTIGFIVKVELGSNMQDIWIADHKKRLLLIKINENQDRICLPDYKLKETQAICNLTLKKSGKSYCVAIANHWTVFSKYPSQKYLRESMEDFNKELPEDLDDFLKKCKENLENILRKENSLSEDDINCSQITDTDRALSLIDFGKFM